MTLRAPDPSRDGDDRPPQRADLEAIIDGWKLCDACDNDIAPGAPDAEIATLKGSIEGLPDDVISLLRLTNGCSVLGGNLTIYPAVGAEVSGGDAPYPGIAAFSDLLRSWDWPVPPEFIVIGDNGQGEQFGVWTNKSGTGSVIAAMAQADASFAVVGTTLPAFLRSWTAYHLLVIGQSNAALDRLDVPTELRRADPDDETFAAIARWSDPDLPHFSMSPYSEAWSADAVRDFVAGLGASHA